MFEEVRPISNVALSILRKRYFREGETTWDDVAKRVINHVLINADQDQKYLTYQMVLNRYFIPNSPCLVNSGKEDGGLSACFVVDFTDSIRGIYETKLNFALIAKKGGGCGTSLTKLRPKNSKVAGSTHGYSGGPVDFFNTICHDMDVMTQAGFRSMAMMATISVYHPDILYFLSAKEEEGKMSNTNMSVVVDDVFMNKVINDETYFTEFNGIQFTEYRAKDIFNLIVEGAWRNGEPGILFYDRMNDAPYKYSHQEILGTNPCGEQPLPPNGVCNLGNLDISKFLLPDKSIDIASLEVATRLGVRFLDSVITRSSYPTDEIYAWAMKNRPIGLGIMGLSDYYLMRGVAYGSKQAIEELEFILGYIQQIAEDESILMGEELGVPDNCKVLPIPRRNITLISIAPTGTVSLIAGCNSSIEPIFSEITIRNDKTGIYNFENDLADRPYFRCAVSANGAIEVTWEEHVEIQAAAQRHCDSGVSKTINFPEGTHRETFAKAIILAWKLKCKGLAMYRDKSRKVQVLTPKALKRDKCPVCGNDIVKIANQKKCSKCEWKLIDTPVETESSGRIEGV